MGCNLPDGCLGIHFLKHGTIHANINGMSTLSLVAIGLVILTCVGWIAMRIRVSIRNPAPVGYEDEHGFHFGAPMEKE